jgi:HipA-like protein
MIEKIKNLLLPAAQRKFRVDEKKAHTFLLKYADLHVGTLTYTDQKWIFEYAQCLKDAKSMKPLANFPDINRRYTDDVLWPFFASRIPSLSRRRVLKRTKEEGIDKKDTISLLKLFGAKTLTNPFVLIHQDSI